MRVSFGLVLASMATVMTFAQAPSGAPATSTASNSAVGGAAAAPILPDLDKLQAAASQSSLEIGRMRIEKWKADGGSKQQAQANAESIQRNLNSALPGMISAVRSAPEDLNAEFRLYRNVNALYDVMVSLAESAGAFGPRNEYEALARQVEAMDSVRRNLGDFIEQLATSKQSELNQVRNQLRAAQQAAAAAAAPPKTTVIDDNEPAKKPTTAHKKKTSTAGSTSSKPAPTPSDQKQ